MMILTLLCCKQAFAYERKTVDITGLETGLDVQHSHILIQQNDQTNHWKECVICHKKFNIQQHDIVRSGSENMCNSWIIESCKVCGYEKSRQHVGHKLILQSNRFTNTATYWHSKYECQVCKQLTCEADDGTKSIEWCTDSSGNRISCANRKKCVVCGYDYSQQMYISHATEGQIYGAASEKMDTEHSGPINTPLEVQCRSCGVKVFRVVKTWAVQSKTDNKHWDFYGIYEVYQPARWNCPPGGLVSTYGPEQNQAFSKTEATVQLLPQQYKNSYEYNTNNIQDYSNVRFITFSCDMTNGYQGTPYIRLNADNLFRYVNGNENEYAKSYDMCFIINPDCTAPQNTEVIIQTGDKIDNWTNRITITGKCTDNYSDTVSMYITDRYGNKLQNTLTVQRDSSNEFRGSIDFSQSGIEIKSNETFYMRFEDRYGNIATKEFNLEYVDTKAPQATSSDTFGEDHWKNKLSVKFTATDNGVGKVQIGFNNESDLDLADEVTNEFGTKTFERWYDFIGDTYSYVTPAVYYKDALGNTTYKLVQLHKLDNTKPTIQDAIANYRNDYSIKISANDINKTLGEGSHVSRYMVVQVDDTAPSQASDSRWLAWTGGNPQTGQFTDKAYSMEDTTQIKQEGHYNIYLLDNAGNISLPTTVEVKKPQHLFITATPDNSGYGSVMVDWSTYDYRNKNFKVYRQSNGIDYESVGIDYTSVTNIRVLQIYPIDAAKNQMKDWMVTQGYGKGIIQVDSVYIDDFNVNPEGYLKDSSDGWKYDVIVLGTWDSNNQKDLNQKQVDVIRKFLETGHGMVAGHDTLCAGKEFSTRNYQQLKDLFSLSQAENSRWYNGVGDNSDRSPQSSEQSTIKIVKTGLFTNYPWVIGDLGQTLVVPGCHSNGQIPVKAATWLKFYEKDYGQAQMNDPANEYLMTYNNTAMMQAGHSNGTATSDEQKIFANIIFYVNQLLFNRYNNKDYAAQDDVQPDNPQIVVNRLKYNIASKDNGRHYYFKVDAYTKDGIAPKNYIETQNVAEADVITGLKGYHYVIDTNADTEVTRSDTFTADTVIQPGVTNYVRYLHVAAIDNAGNISGTTTIKIPARLVITYDKNSNDATGSMEDQSIQMGQSVAAKSCEFTWDKHRFVRWATESNGSGNSYNVGDMLRYDELTSEFGYEMTLYAMWEPLYVLKIDPSGGEYKSQSGVTQSEVTKYWLGQNDQEIIKDATRIGYNFKGWRIDVLR